MDNLAAFLVLIIAIAAFITLGGLVLMMSVGAIFSKRQLVTSWPAEQEHTFQIYEHHNSASNGRAWAASLGAAVFVFIFAAGVYAGVEPDHKDLGKDMNMSNLTKRKSSAAPAPTPAPPAQQQAPAPSPSPTTPPAPAPGK